MKMGLSTTAILLLHLLMYTAVGLNIPILRQIIVFTYLLFIPGFVLLRISGLQKIKVVDTILFSVGLSIAFLMFIGLLMNELYPLLGISRPLTTIPVTITLSVLTLALLFFGYKHNLSGNLNASGLQGMESKAISLKSVLFVLPPLLSIVGALYVSIPILLLMITIITALYALSIFSTRLIPAKLYPLMILVISLALLFHVSLISKYIMGADAPLEYYVFKLTEINGYWCRPSIGINPSSLANFQSMLSITILPTIYSVLLNIKGEITFKVLYPFVFSLVPLILYRIYEKQTGKLVALLSTLFFMSSTIAFFGIEPLSLNRQIIGEYFFLLLIFLLFHESIAPRTRKMLFLTFGVALIMSHYSLTYIYLFYILFIYVISFKKGSNEIISGASVLLFIIMTFSWYMYVSDSPLRSLTNVFERICYSFNVDLLNPEARSSYVYSRISSAPPTILTLIDRMLFYIQHFFILIGVMGLLVKTTGRKFDREYRLISILSIFLMLLCILIPHFATALNLTRFYAIILLFLAPFFPLGGKAVYNGIKKAGTFFVRRSRNFSPRNMELRLVSIVLIASLLFQSGFVYHVTRDVPSSNSLDINRKKTTNNLRIKINFYNVYIPEQDVFGAIWLSKNVNETSRLYADRNSKNLVLTSYGLIPRDRVHLLSNSTILDGADYIYLRHLNVVDGLISTFPIGEPFDIYEIASLLNESNKIYANGDSEIYCGLGS